MNKLFGSFIVFILGINCVNAQGINYQKNLDDALALAAKNNKPVFILIDVPFPSSPPPNLPANVKVNFSTASGLAAKEVVDYYNEKFINYHVSARDSAGIKIRDQYHLTRYPTYIFLDPKGQIFYKDWMNSPVPEKFMSMAGEALGRLASDKTVSYYAELDKRGSITEPQLKAYITLREELGLFDNAALIEKYVSFLTIKSFDDYNQALFVLKAGPYAYGKAFTMSNANRKIIDSIYKHEPLADRVAMNGRIISNTRNEAIKTNNIQLENNAARYAAATWGQNIREANRVLTGEMMAYYKAVKDTANYYQQASSFYDNYYMNINADSAKRLKQNALESFNRSNHVGETTVTHNKDHTTTQVSGIVAVRSGPENSPVASTLNTAAWGFYTMGTHDTNYLLTALVWCRRAIALQPIAGYYDTMAHIMYRLNFYDDAILNQNKAVEMAANEPQSKTEQDNLKAELVKMKAHQL